MRKREIALIIGATALAIAGGLLLAIYGPGML